MGLSDLCLAMCVTLFGWGVVGSDNGLGAEGGAAVAEAMKSCKQLTSVNLAGMQCVGVTGLGWGLTHGVVATVCIVATVC